MLRHPRVLSSALSAESSTPRRDRYRAAASGAVPFQGCRPQRRESTANSRIRFTFQNVRGFQDSPDGSNAKMDELVRHMQRFQVHVAMLAETWRLSQAELRVWNEEQDFMFLHHGLMSSGLTRGRFGLGFFLNPAAREAFNRAEAWQKFYGDRVFAIRLHWKDDRGRLVKCFVAVAHAPTTHHPASAHAEFRSHWQKMLAEVGQDEVLVNAMDANAQLGVAQASSAARANDRRRWDGPDSGAHGRLSSVLGHRGLPRVSRTGRVLLELCREHHLCAPMSFFQHRTYTTWTHPRWRTGHQLDHWFMRRRDLKRVTDARVSGAVTLHSDHRALVLDLRVARNLRLNRVRTRPQRQFNIQSLRRPEVVTEFREAAVRAFSASTATDAGQPSTSTSLLSGLADNMPSASGRPDAVFQNAKAALLSAAEEVLSEEQSRSQPAWFTLGEPRLMRCIRARQSAESLWHHAAGPAKVAAAKAYAAARRAVAREVRRCKRQWLQVQFEGIKPGATPAFYWRHVNRLRGGLGSARDAGSDPLFHTADGEPTTTRLESNEAKAQHWHNVFNRPAQADWSVLEGLRQRPVRDEFSDPPSDEEIIQAIRRAKRGKSPGLNGIPAEFWQALVGTDAELRTAEGQAAFSICREVILQFWRTGECPSDWLTARLKALFKRKGDRCDLNNWRGIAILDAASKVVGSILAARLTNLLTEIGLEEQNGFTPRRGCTDGNFTLRVLLQKRREHGLSTWVVYVDLEKAFDSVPRDALWHVLRKFGLPSHFIRLIMALHSDFFFRVDCGLTFKDILAGVGVKQGDSLAPVLFNVYFQACMEVLAARWTASKPSFYYDEDCVLTGRKVSQEGTLESDYCKSLYADDGAFVFTTRADIESHIPLIYDTLADFGLTMHIGRGDKKGKTEAVFFPAASELSRKLRERSEDSARAENAPRPVQKRGRLGKRRKCASCSAKTKSATRQCVRCQRKAAAGTLRDRSNVAPILVADGFVHFVDRFNYLGSTIKDDLSDDVDCDIRIQQAAGAFGALKSALFQQRRVCPLAKRMAYQALVINLLLYGCESWALSAYMARRLAAFHRRCVRVMTGYTLDMGRVVHEVTGRRTSHAALYRRLGLPNMRTLLTCRRLQWLGHVFRMPPTRMPRKVLASWISCPRPVGRPYLSYGHSILTDLAQAHLRGDTWGYVASNRCRWRSLIESLKRSSSRSLRGRHRPCNPLLPLSLTSASSGNGAHVTPPPPPPPYPDGSLPTPPAYMAHDPDKFWYAQVYSALCDCGHVLKAQLHRYFTYDDSDSDGVGVRP